ncbi:M56 family metallopeptidase [Streptomyces sp. NPDC054904]|uniref:M56 family metallopeptidase n=1 Tax=unclassified Streptomyces TaxID=2593676 RepID=UPI002481CE31|nr:MULTISPECIES: M56 family metallopeptidase [unclassified Streptomyces]MDA5279431.1 M56 family metallopeptidase [Streptomyces sp. Isolate_45]MDX2392728.1 M56 family metallopeptidase [Streptomyces sp. DK15]
MNHHVLPPLGLALITGLVIPWMLLRAHWAQQVPRLGLAVWIMCGSVFALATAILPAQLLLPAETSHRLIDAVLTLSPPSPRRLADGTAREFLAASTALAVLALPGTGFVRELVRARRARGRHAELLRLVGRYDAELGVTVLDDARPAVYCLPGRSRRVVISSGAADVLTEQELAAALAHERAHIAGRHHLLLAAAGAYSTVFRRLPLARIGGQAVPLLLEMAADDRALRGCSRDALATALYALAAGHAPRRAFAAGGPSAAVRMRRILTPHRVGHAVLRGLLAVTAAMSVIVPTVVACCWTS